MSGLYRPTATNSDLDRLYQTGPAVYSACRVWTDNIGAVRWMLVDENDDPVEDHWLADLLSSRSMSDTMKRCEISLRFRGHTLLWKRRNYFNNQIERLRWVNFNLYNLDKYPDMGLLGFNVYQHNSTSEPIPVAYIPLEESIYIHEIDLFDDFDGVSSAEVAFAAAGIDIETLTSALSFFQNAAIGALLIQPAENSPSAPEDKDVKDLGDLLRRVAKGVVNAGRNIITPRRWDVQNLQERFADIAFKELRDGAQETTFMAFDVPIEIVKPTEGNYAQTTEARHSWFQNRFEPRCNWYADHMTEQLVDPIRPGWRCKPDFKDVPGRKDELAKRVEITNAKVTGGYIDLFTAQKDTDTDPDPLLKGLYRVGNTVVPAAQMSQLWRQPPQQGGFTGGSGSVGAGLHLPANPAQSLSVTHGGMFATPPPRTATKSLTIPVGTDDWLDEPVYKELKNWRIIVDRKGRDYPFAAKALPAGTVKFGQGLLTAGYDVDAAFEAIRAHAAAEGKKKLLALKDFAPPAPSLVQDVAETDPVFATPEEYNAYWQRYDKLKDELRRDWLSGYMKKVGPDIVSFYAKLGHAVQPEEVQAILSKHHADLQEAWIGTEDEPGPLYAILLAGFAAGNDALVTDKPAEPMAAKAFGLIVDWSLFSKEALAFARQYFPTLIKGIDATTGQAVQDAIAEGLEGGLTRDQIASKINAVFNDPDRARLIAQTESNNAFVEGALTRWQNAGVTKARWITVNDGNVCDICLRLNGQVADIRTGWTDPKTGTVYRSSAHPGDRCLRSPEAD